MLFTRQSNPPDEALEKPFKIIKAHGIQNNLYCAKSKSHSQSPALDQSTQKVLKSLKSMKTASLSSFLNKQSIAVGVKLFQAIKTMH